MSQRVQSYHLEYNEIEDEVNKFKRFTDGIDRLRNLINPYVTTKRERKILIRKLTGIDIYIKAFEDKLEVINDNKNISRRIFSH